MCDKTQEEAENEAMTEIQKLREANEEDAVLTVGARVDLENAAYNQAIEDCVGIVERSGHPDASFFVDQFRVIKKG